MTEIEDEFLDAFDNREAERIMSGIAAIIEHAKPDAEAARVDAIIARDRQDRGRELDRKQAEMELARGVFVNLSDAVIDPTPEWLAKHDTKTYFPRQLDETTRIVKTVRRVVTPITTRMLRAGKLSDEQSAACDWYRHCFEAAGLDGRYKSSRFGDAGGGGTGMSCAPMAMHISEIEARKAFREARDAIDASLLRGFDAVVLHNVSLVRTARFIRSGKNRFRPVFTKACNQLVAWCQANDIELGAVGG